MGVQGILEDESTKSTRSSDNNVRAFASVTKDLNVFGNRGTTVEGVDADIGHILGKASVLVFDLKGEFTRVAKDYYGDFAIDRFQLLECRKNENCSFSMSRLCLTQNVHSKNSLRNAFLLN